MIDINAKGFQTLTEESDINEALSLVNEGRGYNPNAGETLTVTGKLFARVWLDANKHPQQSVYFGADVTTANGTVIKDQKINFSVLTKRFPKERADFIAKYPVMGNYGAEGKALWSLVQAKKTFKVTPSAEPWLFRTWDKDGNETAGEMRTALIYE